MIPVTITYRSTEQEPHEAPGFAPDADCPLAVGKFIQHDSHTGWLPVTDLWCIIHRPSGYTLGKKTFKTRKAAEAVLIACIPDFPGWLFAKGGSDDVATQACHVMFRMALANV